jgi:hypothetical protein
MRRYAGASRVCVQSSGKWSCRAGTSSCVIVGIESELRDGAGDAPIIGAQELEKRKESRERGAGPSPSMSTGHLAKDEVKKLRSRKSTERSEKTFRFGGRFDRTDHHTLPILAAERTPASVERRRKKQWWTCMGGA